MFCSKCGTELSENAKFCSKCGYAVIKAYRKEPPASIPANPNPYAEIAALVPDGFSADSVSEKPVAKAKPNPFAFVSAGFMAVTLLLYFVPWFFIEDKVIGMFSYYIGCLPFVYPDDMPAILFLISTFIACLLLILGIITAIIRKNRIPLVFAIASSVLIHLSAAFFIFTKEAWTIGVSITPIIIYLMTFFNIAFAIPAKIK